MFRRILLFIVLLAVIAALFSGYEFLTHFTYTRQIVLPANMLAASSTDASLGTASTTPDVFGDTDPAATSPAFSSIDTSSWVTYTSSTSGYTLLYPPDLSQNIDASGNLVLALSSSGYFHWPLLDDVKVTVIASSSCPLITTGASASASTTVTANGYSFVRSEGGGVAAGNIYRELAYDTVSGGTCYHFDLLDHGANGAGLYVSDQSLITRYNTQHTSDLSAVVLLFNAIVNSFRSN